MAVVDDELIDLVNGLQHKPDSESVQESDLDDRNGISNRKYNWD